jgi:L-lactate dehydrogenase complex protein LldE
MVEKKAANAAAAEPALLLAGDLGCLMNIAGKLKREGRALTVRHVAEVLAGELSTPPVGASS